MGKSHTEWADKLIAGLPELIRDAMRDDFLNRIDAAMDLGSKKAISAEVVAADMDLFLLGTECSKRLEDRDIASRDKLLQGKTTRIAAFEIIAGVNWYRKENFGNKRTVPYPESTG